jgi:antitoxin component YwqK of YwqJK toxin-antitoxin module
MNYLEGQKTGIWTNWDEQGLILASKNYSQLN